MNQKCLTCGTAFFGRSDKKFCSDQCRSAHHHLINQKENRIMNSINQVLRQNRRILAELNTKKKTRVHRKQLLERGFKFKYFTNLYTTRAGHTYNFCYDQGYIEWDDDTLTLVEKQAYIE